ncbi:hypothetical protein [Lacinutrix sp. Bg11-31]|uniref:hypothetical protein n=1 Tax=Lacinutrix sp. Bg11-31 TaxID=2057808 RepID=UPI000C300514|nr:hypothetical protein [Lacinutrix sp. Bg11-31]AUC83406.1 hypothetical protein CW733_15205 [Lacinutrix sp. Bg11-31]
MKLLRILFHVFLILILTVFTQVGGLIWLITLIIWKYKNWKKRYVFAILYLVCNLLIVPSLSKHFGREQLPISNDNLKPRNLFYPLFFRNYVTPELKELLIKSSETLKTENIKITYLDANFPFYNGFSLLPHRSHNDGKKIDISFIYKTKEGQITDKKPALSGYGIYVIEENYNTINCIKKGYWQYDFTKYLTLGEINDLDFDAINTKKVILTFLSQNKTQKIFIEPYLKKNLGLVNYSKIRFHGCKAVRHDDHIHLQIK